MQGLTDGSVRNHLFHLELNNLEDAISAAEQEDLSIRKEHDNPSSYRPTSRQVTGGPETINLCLLIAKDLALRTTSDYRKAIPARSWNTTLTSVVFSA